MQNQSALITGGAPSAPGMTETIKSRFGDITIDTGKAVVFPRGLLGLPDKFNFVLTPFPSEKMQQFTLLQSLDDKSLAFITLPLNMDNPIISEADLKTACRDLQIAETSLAALLVVSVHRNPAQVRLSVNARAPLLIDAERRMGVQYVFQNDQYKVQHMLG
jgi:flagellar assembly factor FliW